MADVVSSDAYGKSVERLTRQYLARQGASAVSKTVGGLGAGFGAGELTHLLGAGNPLTAVAVYPLRLCIFFTRILRRL